MAALHQLWDDSESELGPKLPQDTPLRRPDVKRLEHPGFLSPCYFLEFTRPFDAVGETVTPKSHRFSLDVAW